MTRRVYFLSSLLLLSLSVGCFHQETKNEAHIATTPSLTTVSQRALSPFFEEGSLDSEWWHLFSDPQLDALIAHALKESPTLKMAEAKVVAAQAGAKAVRSKLFPTLTASAKDNWQYLSKYGFDRSFFPIPSGYPIPSKYNETDLSLNFSYELDFWGKNRKKLAEALGLAVAEEMEKAEATLILCTAVAFAYFEWQSHFAEKALYEKWLSSEEKLEQFFSSRYEMGLNNLISSLEQKQQLEEIRQKVIVAQKELEIDVFFLSNLIGEGPDYSLSLKEAPEVLTKKIPIPDSIELNLIAQRPDLMAQIWRVESASKAIGVAKTEFYPNVNLAAFAGLSSLTFPHLFQWASRTGTLYPAINLPIFTGGNLQANLSTKVALFNESVFSYNTLLLQAAQEVASELSTFLSLESQLKVQLSIVDAQKKTYELFSLRYQTGVDNYSNVLEASNTLFSQEINEIRLKHASILSAIRLVKSLGGGMNPQKLPNIHPSTSP